MTAQKVKTFVEQHCRLSKHPFNGQPIKLQPWQTDLIDKVYGTVDSNGNRIYRNVSCWIPRKNAKSTTCAALALYHLLEVEGAEVYIVACDKEQAGCIFSECAHFVEVNPKLNKFLWVRRNIKVIEWKKNKSVLRVLSSEGSNKGGYNPTACFMDEVGAWGCHGQEIYDLMTSGSLVRQNPLFFTISTAYYARGFGYELFRRAQKIAKQPSLDPTWLSVIYALSDEEDWQSEANWAKVNPMCGLTFPLSALQEAYERAKENAQEETKFRCFHLNQFCGSASQFIPSRAWDACGQPISESELYGQPGFIGLDMARRFDLASYAVLVPKGDHVYAFPRFFIPREMALEKQRKDNVPYLRWANDPKTNLFLTDGDVIDPGFVRKKMIEDSKNWKINRVAFDPYGAEEMRQILEYQYGLSMIEVKQTPRHMSPSYSEFERLVISKRLVHPRNPILDWCVNNASATIDKFDNVMVYKGKGDTQRIDGLVAIAVGLAGMASQDKAQVFDRSFAIVL